MTYQKKYLFRVIYPYFLLKRISKKGKNALCRQLKITYEFFLRWHFILGPPVHLKMPIFSSFFPLILSMVYTHCDLVCFVSFLSFSLSRSLTFSFCLALYCLNINSFAHTNCIITFIENQIYSTTLLLLLLTRIRIETHNNKAAISVVLFGIMWFLDSNSDSFSFRSDEESILYDNSRNRTKRANSDPNPNA